MCHRLCLNHTAEMFEALVQQTYLSLLLRLHALSISVKIEHLCSLETHLAQGAPKAECNMNCLENAQCLADNLAHMMVL